jgi:opacity protein-like surface antigen
MSTFYLRGIVFSVVFMALAGIFGDVAVARDRTGDYVVYRGIGGYSLVDDVTETSGGKLQIRNDEDIVGGMGFAAGYDWAKKGLPLRTELEYHYRARMDFDTRVVNGTAAGFENQLSTHAVMANLYFDFKPLGAFKPYVGAGAGWVRNVSDVDRVPLAGTAKEERTDEKDNFGWSVMAGVMYQISQGWQFEVGYRFIDLGEVKSGAFNDGTVMTAESYVSHDLILGLIYRF